MTAVRFPDPQLAVRDAVRAILAARGVAAEVSTRTPAGAPVGAPYVLVRTDAVERTASLDCLADVAVTVWAADEGAAVDLACVIEALLLDHTGPDIRAVRPDSGPVPGTDTDGVTPIVYFRVTAHMRPRNI